MDEKRRHCGRVGMLDCGGSRAPPQQGTDLGPGTYQIPSFTDLLAAKKAGKNSRGPYEVFSLDRDQPVKTGHYARMSTGNLGPGQYNFKDGVADLNRPEKRNHGKFLKMVQYPAKPCDRIYWMTPATVPPDPTNKVSAASYHPTDPNFKKESFSKSEAGFLSTSNRTGQAFANNQVGPGRYDIQRQEDTAHVNAHTNDFVSKTEARLSHGQQQVYRERLRDKDIPPGRRFRVDHVATEKEPFVNIQPLFAARDPLVIQ
uniref:Uncharacterized protein n=1 Tax=Macrostomum lignano TaxID=282301 RepID=A0A1I8HJN3_9PLAT